MKFKWVVLLIILILSLGCLESEEVPRQSVFGVGGEIETTTPPTTPETTVDAPTTESSAPITFSVVPDKLSPNARVGNHYSYSFCKPDLGLTSDLCDASATIPSGGNPPYSFSLGPGTGFPPFGLNLNLNGILSGTPTEEGKRLFEVCAKDIMGNQACQKVTLVVESDPSPPTSPPPTTPPPTTSVDVKIENAVCSIQDYFYDILVDIKLTGTGTASGPVGTSLNVALNDGDSCSQNAGLECESWTIKGTGYGTRCVRMEGDPETTSWITTRPHITTKTKEVSGAGVCASVNHLYSLPKRTELSAQC